MTTSAAVVTGSSRGIGRAIALGLAHDGFDIVVNYRRDADAAAETVDEIRRLDREAVAVQGSVDDESDCERLAAAAVQAFDTLAVLVHNAGVASRGLPVADTPADEVHRLLAANAIGPHTLTRLLLPKLRDHGSASIVFVSSAATRSMPANGAPYNMGKAAMEALAKTLSHEERPYGTRVNVVAPGIVETEMGRRLVRATTGVVDIHELDERMPFGRFCQPEDVADVVRWFVSPSASYITGETITVHGGG